MQVEHHHHHHPMVVTPAPSSPENLPQDLDRLWQGRRASRRIHDPQQLAHDFANTTTWKQADASCQTVRLCGMIQDIGETEFLPVVGSDGTEFVERLPITVVTDYGDDKSWQQKQQQQQQNDDSVLEHRGKRTCREKSKTPADATTMVVYVYYPSHEQSASPIRTELQLHQIVEWIAVKEQDLDEGEMMVDVTLLRQNAQSLSATWSEDSTSTCISTTTMDWKFPRLHALFYCLQTMDDLYLASSLASPQEQQPVMETPEAILFLSEALHIPHALASALWLTLLSRAEPVLANTNNNNNNNSNTLLGCASMQFVVPTTALADKWVQLLQALLEPAVPLCQTWNAAHLSTVPRLTQRHGRIRRHAWQLPAGSTVVVQNYQQQSAAGWATAVLPALIQQHQMPLVCEGCQQVPLAADWRFLVVSTPATRHALACTTTVDLSAWTPGFTQPPAVVHARWARTLAARRACTPTVALSTAVRDRAPADFCRLRQTAPVCPDEAAFHRWLTWTRLWARSRGAATAQVVDWERALQLDQSLMQQSV